MSKRSDDIVRQDILNAGKLILEFVDGFDMGTFIDDWKTRSAVLYQLTVVGEAVKRLSNRVSCPAYAYPLGFDRWDARASHSRLRLG